MRPLPLIGLLLVVWVQEAHACSCRAIVNKRTQNWERPWAGRDVVFTGYAIEIDQSYDPVQRTVTRLVRFVTEQSWRGALPDTITLFVNADAPCSQYSPGWRYLVTANWDARARGRLTTAVCDYSLGADWKVARQLWEEEGPPGWTAPQWGVATSTEEHSTLGRQFREHLLLDWRRSYRSGANPSNKGKAYDLTS